MQAGGFGGSAPASPGTSGQNPGQLHARLAVSKDQLCLTLWPALVLRNEMPCPVAWRLASTEEEEAFSFEATAQQLHCPPGRETPLHARCYGAETLSFCLESHQQEVVFYQACPCSSSYLMMHSV